METQISTHERPRQMLRAREVAELLDVAIPTVYERARMDPESLGAVRIGRSVRFRRAAVERIVCGAES